MKSILTLTLLLISQLIISQVNYGIPPEDSIPEKLKGIKRAIKVNHFPKENDPIKIKDLYYWKHTTAILCKESEVTITEYGAYIFYNNTWNLRKSYPLKELDKTFGTKKQHILQGQPYIWPNNWRVDKKLFGGWAMWYFIGKTTAGELVCGYETINTTTNLLNN